MYLSKLELDPSHSMVRRDLANPYEMHRTLSRVFAVSADEPPGRFLWRQEKGREQPSDAVGVVLVQSERPGNWQAIDELKGYALKRHPDKHVDLARLVQPGCSYVFRLISNPTVTRVGKRYGLLREAEQLEWLQRQSQQHGFEILRVDIVRSERMAFRQGQNGHFITIQVVQFDGVLRVQEAGRMVGAVLRGIGHAKARGFGMLSLAPVHQGP